MLKLLSLFKSNQKNLSNLSVHRIVNSHLAGRLTIWHERHVICKSVFFYTSSLHCLPYSCIFLHTSIEASSTVSPSPFPAPLATVIKSGPFVPRRLGYIASVISFLVVLLHQNLSGFLFEFYKLDDVKCLFIRQCIVGWKTIHKCWYPVNWFA